MHIIQLNMSVKQQRRLIGRLLYQVYYTRNSLPISKEMLRQNGENATYISQSIQDALK